MSGNDSKDHSADHHDPRAEDVTETRGMGRRGFLGWGAAASGAAILGSLGLPGSAAAHTPSGTSATSAAPAVSAARAAFTAAAPVAAATRGARMTAQALGVNTTGYDSHFADAVVPQLLKDAGIGRIRYPGGGNADSTNWEDPRLGLPWPTFMKLLAQIGAAPMNTINYGQLYLGPQAAAAWVADALTYPNYDPATAVWVLGNEGYGPWERDEHPEPHTATSYAANARPYFEAMHAVDPRTRVGFPMTIDRTVAGGTGTWVADPDAWNRTVMHANADQLDFVDFHWYPVFGIPVMTNADIFATLDKIPGAYTYLRGIIDAEKAGVPIVASEGNISQSEIVYNVQPVSALFAVATSLRWLAQGVESYMWWQVHNSDNMNGDFGFLSDGTGSPGPTVTKLTAAAAPGARFMTVADATGLHHAHQFTIGTGSNQESRKILALPGSTTLTGGAGSGSTNIKVAATETLTTAGATTDHRPFFAPGTVVTVGDGNQAEQRIVTAVGTATGSTALAAPAAAGDRVVKIVGTGMGGQAIPVFMPTALAIGGQITVGTGAAAETATIAAIGTSSSLGTALAGPVAVGDTVIHVESVTNTNTGVANYAGDDITIDTGKTEEVRTITAVGSSATTPTTLAGDVRPGARRVFLANTAGVTVGHSLLLGTGPGAEQIGTIVAIGNQVATTLAAASAAGDTVVRVASTSGLAAGHPMVIDTGSNLEVRTILAVGSAGPTGTGVTLTAALGKVHAAGAAARDAGTGVVLDHPVRNARATGHTVRDLGSGITVSAPLKRAHAIGAPTRDTGSGVTLTAPLARAHADGAPVTTPGTGITLDRPLGRNHNTGTAVHVDGVTITPALSRDHGKGTAVNELGLKEPALNTPLPAYWGFVMASKMTTPGATLVEMDRPSPTVFAFASTLNGDRKVCLVNTDDTAATTVTVDGLAATGNIEMWQYGLTNPTLTDSRKPASSLSTGVTLPPESVTIIGGSTRAGVTPKASTKA